MIEGLIKIVFYIVIILLIFAFLPEKVLDSLKKFLSWENLVNYLKLGFNRLVNFLKDILPIDFNKIYDKLKNSLESDFSKLPLKTKS